MTLSGAGPGAPVRVSLVHERFTEFAGSEAVVEQLAREWPDAPLVAPVARAGVMPADLEPRVRTTRLSRLLRGGSYAHLLPLLPVAMANLPVPPSDVVVASHHAFANQVVHATDTPVVSYVHSPARWVWDPNLRAGEVGGRLGQRALGAFAAAYRPADVRAAARVHTLVANSTAVASRIEDWWQRPSVVVHPPVDTERYVPDPEVPREDFFLLAGRLVAYKRPELAIRAAQAAGVRLVVVGEGRARAEAEALAGPGTVFLGRVDDDELLGLFRRCSALLMPGVEDFGIVPVEAQACSTPVLAIDAGGTQDSVLRGVTGEMVPQSATFEAELEDWTAALRDFDPARYDPQLIRKHAEGFSRATFRARMRDVVDGVLATC